ncbi:MAG: hypothetical protein N2053_13110, partial [Chitinispirillaceae bacterium]|nr:hypothetical protein [Chitinispirillaceae bacterium]
EEVHRFLIENPSVAQEVLKRFRLGGILSDFGEEEFKSLEKEIERLSSKGGPGDGIVIATQDPYKANNFIDNSNNNLPHNFENNLIIDLILQRQSEQIKIIVRDFSCILSKTVVDKIIEVLGSTPDNWTEKAVMNLVLILWLAEKFQTEELKYLADLVFYFKSTRGLYKILQRMNLDSILQNKTEDTARIKTILKTILTNTLGAIRELHHAKILSEDGYHVIAFNEYLEGKEVDLIIVDKKDGRTSIVEVQRGAGILFDEEKILEIWVSRQCEEKFELIRGAITGLFEKLDEDLDIIFTVEEPIAQERKDEFERVCKDWLKAKRIEGINIQFRIIPTFNWVKITGFLLDVVEGKREDLSIELEKLFSSYKDSEEKYEGIKKEKIEELGRLYTPYI